MKFSSIQNKLPVFFLGAICFLFCSCNKGPTTSLYTLHQDFISDIAPLTPAKKNNGPQTIADLSAQNERLTTSSFAHELLHKQRPIDVSQAQQKKDTPNQKDSVIPTLGNEAIQVRHSGLLKIKEGSIPFDRIYDYYYEDRQWFTNYVLDPYQIELSSPLLFIRNNHRLFALDQHDLTILYSYSPHKDTNGEENYYTFYHPHINERNFLMAMDGNQIYSELTGKLSSVRFHNTAFSENWKIDLDGYRSASAPIIADNAVIFVLINSKKEVWIASFSKSDGTVLWSHFMGISSYTSSTSPLSYVEKGKAYIATNLGFSARVDLSTGTIDWLHRDQPKNHSIFWFLDHFPQMGRDSTRLAAESEIIWSDETSIYYHSKESPYLYRLNKEQGSELFKVEVSSGEKKLVGRFETGLVLIEQSAENEIAVQLATYDLSNIRRLTLIKGKIDDFKGMAKFKEKTAFKMGNQIIELRRENKQIIVEIFQGDLEGDLLAYNRENFLLKNKEKIVAVSRNGAPSSNQSHKLSKLPLVTRLTEAECREYASLIQEQPIDQLPKDKNVQVAQDCRDTIIDVQGIKIYLYLLIEDKLNFSKRPLRISRYRLSGKKLHHKGENIGGFFFYFLEQDIHNPQTLFAINGDQLVHLSKEGDILWSKKLFKERGNTAKNEVLLQHSNDQKIVVVKDRQNIIALNKSNGAYLWSYSLPLPNPHDYTFSKPLHTVPFHIYNDIVVIFNDREIKSVKLQTGVPVQSIQLTGESSTIYFLKDRLIAINDLGAISEYLVPALHLENTVKLEEGCLLDKDFSQAKIYDLPQGWVILGEFCGLSKIDGRLNYTPYQNGQEQAGIVLKDQSILSWDYASTLKLIRPPYLQFGKTTDFSLPSNNKTWLPFYDPKLSGALRDRPFLELPEQLAMAITQTDQGIALNIFDSKKSKLFSPVYIENSKGEFFARLSNTIRYKNDVFFILSTVTTEQMKSGAHADVEGRLIQFNLDSKKIVSIKSTAAYSTYRYSRPVLQLIDNRLFYSVANYMIHWEDLK